MIFVTVGTHEQQFDRLIKKIDDLKKSGDIEEDVVIQTGYSTYEPQCCKWEKMLTFKAMQEMIEKARIIITHGGPSSFIAPLQIGKIPLVVPRRKQFGEHVNDHQVEFVKMAAERQKNIIPVYDIEALGNILHDYEKIIREMPASVKSNNAEFNRRLDKIVDEIMGRNSRGKRNG